MRQEAREKQAQTEREAKELDGCTFEPQLFSKKRHTASHSEAGGNFEEFLREQQKFAEKTKRNLTDQQQKQEETKQK